MKHLIALNDTGQCYSCYEEKIENDSGNNNYQYGWKKQKGIYQIDYSKDIISELVLDEDVPGDNIYDIFVLIEDNYGHVDGTQLLFSFDKIANNTERKYYCLMNDTKINIDNYILVSNINKKLNLKIYNGKDNENNPKLCSFRYRIINNFEIKNFYKPFFTVDEKYKCLGSGNFTNNNEIQYCLHPTVFSEVKNGAYEIFGSNSTAQFTPPVSTSILYEFTISYDHTKHQYSDGEDFSYRAKTTFSLGLPEDRTNIYNIYKNIPVGELLLDGSFEDYIKIIYSRSSNIFRFQLSNENNVIINSVQIRYLTV